MNPTKTSSDLELCASHTNPMNDDDMSGTPGYIAKPPGARLSVKVRLGDLRSESVYFCGWTRSISHHRSESLEVPTNHGFAWFQSGANGFCPSTVSATWRSPTENGGPFSPFSFCHCCSCFLCPGLGKGDDLVLVCGGA